MAQIIKNMTRGGQTFLHNLRMINQVLNQVIVWLLPVGLLASLFYFVLTTTLYERYIAKQWLWAQFFLFFDGAEHTQLFRLADGQIIRVYAAQLLHADFMQASIAKLSLTVETSLWFGAIIYLLIMSLVFFWLKRRGHTQSEAKQIKGDYLAEIPVLKKIIRNQGKTSALSIGREQLPLPYLTEMQHFLFHGTTGSGKSTSIKEFLDEIRVRGERAIIYDKSCQLVKQFYSSASDQLMNPLDKRTASWSLWRECHDKADFESLSAALIPMPPGTQDPFWINAARTIFAAASFRLRKEKNPKILPLLRHLLTADIQALQYLLKGTEAEALISEKSEKTAISIKSVLATYLKCLCFIKEDETPFSIRQWVQQDQAQGWLFLSSLGDKHESLKPLITAWLDIAVNALLSLPENDHRRIWIILDELTSLQQLPYLTTALSEARKFGGCFVIGVQSYAQLAKVYGHEGAKEISSLLNTRFMFRIPDPDIAQWSARNLGEIIVEEVREGISYGANTMRDGVSVNRIERTKPVVSYSEIMNLANLNCYVRLAGAYPLAKLAIPFKKRPPKNTPFELRDFEPDDLRSDVIELTENLSSTAPASSIDIKNSEKKEKVRKRKVEKSAAAKSVSVQERIFE